MVLARRKTGFPLSCLPFHCAIQTVHTVFKESLRMAYIQRVHTFLPSCGHPSQQYSVHIAPSRASFGTRKELRAVHNHMPESRSENGLYKGVANSETVGQNDRSQKISILGIEPKFEVKDGSRRIRIQQSRSWVPKIGTLFGRVVENFRYFISIAFSDIHSSSLWTCHPHHWKSSSNWLNLKHHVSMKIEEGRGNSWDSWTSWLLFRYFQRHHKNVFYFLAFTFFASLYVPVS